jgi:uncharacterized protein (DUF1501 family)
MTHSFPVSRRVFLSGLGAVTFLSASDSYAASQARPKLLLVILRGAMDGLYAVPKLDDPNLQRHRPSLIPQETRALSDGFALHGAFNTLHSWYQAGEASIVHALAGPWRDRSHFLAQDLLESGGIETVAAQGWLNRALQAEPSLSAVSIGPATPLILSGKAPASSWSPPVLPEASEETLARLLALYEGDAPFQSALAKSIETDAIASGIGMMKRGGGTANFAPPLEGASRLLAAANGPDIAVVSLDGWDTHSGQAGKLARAFKALDDGLAKAKTALGQTWQHTTIACVTEFGRTVRENGSKGTDHGTAGTAFLAGGGIRGGKMLGDWPGLSPAALFEDRDLAPVNDMHGLFKALLTQLYGFDRNQLARVFPYTKGTQPLNLGQ